METRNMTIEEVLAECQSYGLPDGLREVAPVPPMGQGAAQAALIDIAAGMVTLAGSWAEFGVRRGKSARAMLAHLPPGGALHLFDSFQGIPEEWIVGGNRRTRPAGAGTCLPIDQQPSKIGVAIKADDRVKVHVGWFSRTVAPWAQTEKEPLSFVNVDCDLYSSTVDILSAADHLLQPGTVMIFDELVGYPNWREHEWKALNEWLLTRPDLSYEFIGRSGYYQAALVLTRK